METKIICKKWQVMSIFSVLLLSLLVSSCKNNNMSTNAGTGSPGANEVWMQNIAFNPNVLNVSVGTTVKWTNKDNVNHTVTSGTPTSPSGLFDSGTIAPNGTFSFTFSAAGTYPYFCRVHSPKMTGTVIVK
jgi:plastocyanin